MGVYCEDFEESDSVRTAPHSILDYALLKTYYIPPKDQALT